MPSLKAKINGDWIKVAGIPIDSDADTLDGKHADEFALISDIEELRALIEDNTSTQATQVKIITWEADD